MRTLSKALGASGGYICGSRGLIEWLINRARSFIFSTAPPPGIAAAASAAIDFLASPEGEGRRLLLWKRIDLMRELLPVNAMNKKGSAASSAIFPWIVGHERAALDLASALQHEGFLVPAIRYPTVAKASARLRITVTAAHDEDHIRALCEAIKRNAYCGIVCGNFFRACKSMRGERSETLARQQLGKVGRAVLCATSGRRRARSDAPYQIKMLAAT